MTPSPPLSTSTALEHLTDALGANYGGPLDDPALERALKVDSLTVQPPNLPAVTYPRPWATAARLIRDNTEYEVSGELKPRIDRKLAGLMYTQRGMDTASGILELVTERDALLSGMARSGVALNQAAF